MSHLTFGGVNNFFFAKSLFACAISCSCFFFSSFACLFLIYKSPITSKDFKIPPPEPSFEVIGDLYIKNKQAKEEKKKQEQEIAQAKRLLAKKKLLTPPNVKWDNTVALRYQGTINRHNQKSGLNFAFTQNLSQGKFYYNFNNKIEQGNIVFTGTNQHGYWFKWNDKYGQGNLQLREYTDGSLRGVIYIDDGTMLGKKLGNFIGFSK